MPFTATLLMLQLGAGVVLAAEPEHPPNVALRVRACPEPFETALRRMLAIELGNLLDDARATETSKLESIEIACVAEKAQISARSSGGDQVAHNDLRFDAFPSDAAPRAVALAALEALRAIDPTLSERLAAQRAEAQANANAPPTVAADAPSANPPLETAVRPAPAEETTPAEAVARSPARAARPFTRLMVGGGVRHFVAAPATTLFGGRVELSHRFGAPLDAGLDLDGGMSRRYRLKLGRVDAKMLSSAAWLAVRAGSAGWSTSAGLGGRVGVVHLEGTPGLAARGHSALRPWAGALLVVRADGAVGSFAFGIAGEGGYAFAGAQGLAADAPALRLDGLWIAVSANAGLRFAP